VLDDVRHLDVIELVVPEWIRICVQIMDNINVWRRPLVETDGTGHLPVRSTAQIKNSHSAVAMVR
jgi:hypothetical protein